jgi:hypothetical protein
MSVWQRSSKIVEKSEAAMISAIEIYNKPDFKYREETFALLALNAWELLLKAKLLSDNSNDPKSIYVRSKRLRQDGTESAKEYIRRNRCGNPQTVGLVRAIVMLNENASSRLDPAVKANLEGLMEIRDNAAHFFNAGAQLAKQVLEIGTAAVRNYISISKKWFNRDLSRYNLFLMPIGFLSLQSSASALVVGSDEKNIIAYLTRLAGEDFKTDDSDYCVSLNVNLSFQRTKIDPAAAVFVTTDPNAPHVNVSEEDIFKTYPWDYAELTQRLKKRFIDFKEDKKYHDIRKSLLTNPTLVNQRFLDPRNVSSTKKNLYSPNIVQIFDQQYTRK